MMPCGPVMQPGAVLPARATWADARAAAAVLARRPADRRNLALLTHLPLLPERVAERLAGLGGGASVYRSLARLAAAGLVACIRPKPYPGHAPRLWYPTDLGLAAAALSQGSAPAVLARRHGLRGRDLRALLPGLPQLLAVYELLAALAAAGPGRPQLLAWEQPWRRRYLRPTATTSATVTLPAAATLAWEQTAAQARTCATVLLLPDLATAPLRAFRTTLGQMLALRRVHGVLPPLVIATADPGRAAAWRALLEETRAAWAEAPLVAGVVVWSALPAALAALPEATRCSRTSGGRVLQLPVPAWSPPRPGAAVPRLVGTALAGATAVDTSGSTTRITRDLTVADRALLDLVGRHPFLSPEQLAAVLGSSTQLVRRRAAGLEASGLLRRLGAADVGDVAGQERRELTVAGLQIVAAGQGLTLPTAVRVNGLAGGGPEQPVGNRRSLLRHPAHTFGADAIFAGLAATIQRRAAAGSDDALLLWQNAAACSRGSVRPDGYGLVRHAGRRYGFFLEYDRGTMRARDYRAKLAAYYAYWTSGRFARDYDGGLPTVLVVTEAFAAEARIAQVARAAAVGRVAALPLLLTTSRHVTDSRNPDGLFGPIWRTPAAVGGTRRAWFPTPGEARGPPAQRGGPHGGCVRAGAAIDRR